MRTTNATDGTWTITFDGQTTATLPWNATATEVQAALEAFSNVAPGDVTVTGGPAHTGNVTVTFTGALANRNVAQMTTNATALTFTAGAPAATTAQGGPGTVNKVQTVRTTNATDGTWTITFDGQTTAPCRGTPRRRRSRPRSRR